MINREMPVIAFILVITLLFSTGCSDTDTKNNSKTEAARSIITSDTILSGMTASLLPPDRYSVEAILPPGQCPGHYDVKLSDIEKMKKADLIVLFKGIPFVGNSHSSGKIQLEVDAAGRNCMVPDSYIYCLNLLAGSISKHFQDDTGVIMNRKHNVISEVRHNEILLKQKIQRSGVLKKAVIASSMQKEPLEWMGFYVAGEYGRPESMSAKELIELLKIGKKHKVIAVVDNLQSGPNTGAGIAETLGVPHIVLTNFPTEKGYLETLKGNVEEVLAKVSGK